MGYVRAFSQVAQDRRTRGNVLMLFSTLSILVAVLLSGENAADGSEGTPQVLRAKAFELVNEKGQVTARLSNAKGQGPTFELLSEAGKTIVQVAVLKDGTGQIGVTDSSGTGILLQSGEDWGLTMFSSDDRLIRLCGEGSSGVQMSLASKKAGGSVRISAGSVARLGMKAGKGDAGIQIISSESGLGEIMALRPSGKPSLTLLAPSVGRAELRIHSSPGRAATTFPE